MFRGWSWSIGVGVGGWERGSKNQHAEMEDEI
jgi:hypothetical protein